MIPDVVDIFVIRSYNCVIHLYYDRGDAMNKLKKLPDAEFDIMKVVWANEPPITSVMIMEQLGKARSWKIQSVITLLLRLVERGYLRTEKSAKDRTYYPLVNKEDYLKFETEHFVKRFHDNSLFKLIDSLYSGKTLSEADVDDLYKWARERKG